MNTFNAAKRLFVVIGLFSICSLVSPQEIQAKTTGSAILNNHNSQVNSITLFPKTPININNCVRFTGSLYVSCMDGCIANNTNVEQMYKACFMTCYGRYTKVFSTCIFPNRNNQTYNKND